MHDGVEPWCSCAPLHARIRGYLALSASLMPKRGRSPRLSQLDLAAIVVLLALAVSSVQADSGTHCALLRSSDAVAYSMSDMLMDEHAAQSLPPETLRAFGNETFRARLFCEKYALRGAAGTVQEHLVWSKNSSDMTGLPTAFCGSLKRKKTHVIFPLFSLARRPDQDKAGDDWPHRIALFHHQ